MAKIELHAHTSRYSACSRMTPEEALHAAASKVDVLVLTEHNILWPQDELMDLQRQAPPHLTVLTGVEISTDLGHLLCCGLTELPHIEPDRTPATEIIALTHDAGGAVAVAHPFRWGNGDAWYDPKLAIDAVEVASSNTNDDAGAQAALPTLLMWLTTGVPAIIAPRGSCYPRGRRAGRA